MTKLTDEIKEVETELERVNVLDSKWKFVNEKVETMKQMVAIKTAGVTEKHLSQIIDEFTENLSGLNDKLASVIDESIALTEQKTELQEHYVSIKEELGVKGREMEEWKKLLGVSSEEDYQRTREGIQVALKENKKNMQNIQRLKVCVRNGRKELHRRWFVARKYC